MMAGFLIVFDKLDSLEKCIAEGIYSTYLKFPSRYPKNTTWSSSASGTLADYISMKPGDNLYFFSSRKIYGVAEIVDMNLDGISFFQCWKDSIILPTRNELDDCLFEPVEIDGKGTYYYPWAVAFKPAPYVFKDPIDMDQMLASNPESFKALRCLQARSFIKFDEKENRAFKSLFYRRNEKALIDENIDDTYFVDYRRSCEIATEYSKKYPIQFSKYVERHLKNDNQEKFATEANLETSLMFDLNHDDSLATSVFGKWDYLSHQVHASPAKPVEYMDRIDIFGYRYIPADILGEDNKFISKYLIIELKNDSGNKNDVLQLMKYVDWVAREYAGNDYSMIEAYLVAPDFKSTAYSECNKSTKRYTNRAKPNRSKVIIWESLVWEGINLTKYTIQNDFSVKYELIDF